MRIFKALKHSQIRWLWGGQVFSAVGDEVYSIALIWYATSLLGTNAGYISAIQAASIFVFGLAGGALIDRFDHRRLMIVTDLLRALTVLSLPLVAHFSQLTLGLVIPVAIVVSSLAAFFNPALAAFLPELTKDRKILQATNGLMETTSRFAKIIGPGFVAILSRQIPLIHYFTVDAFSFFISAGSISQVRSNLASAEPEQTRLGIKATLLAGYRLSKSQPVLRYTVYSGALAGAAWIFILPLGMTLLIRERLPTNISALGYLISAYGCGNIMSNLTITSFDFRRPERWIYSGRLIAGAGIVGLSLSATMPQMMLASALTAIGGPLTDLGYVNLIQKVCAGKDIARLYRYVMALGQGSLLLVYVTSPRLLQIFSVPTVVAFAGVVVFVTGFFGFVIRRRNS